MHTFESLTGKLLSLRFLLVDFGQTRKSSNESMSTRDVEMLSGHYLISHGWQPAITDDSRVSESDAPQCDGTPKSDS